ncbi:MAG: hypothetical protein MHM6MM_002257 [Cercozoa sp. M6MM]
MDTRDLRFATIRDHATATADATVRLRKLLRDVSKMHATLASELTRVVTQSRPQMDAICSGPMRSSAVAITSMLDWLSDAAQGYQQFADALREGGASALLVLERQLADNRQKYKRVAQKAALQISQAATDVQTVHRESAAAVDAVLAQSQSQEEDATEDKGFWRRKNKATKNTKQNAKKLIAAAEAAEEKYMKTVEQANERSRAARIAISSVVAQQCSDESMRILTTKRVLQKCVAQSFRQLLVDLGGDGSEYERFEGDCEDVEAARDLQSLADALRKTERNRVPLALTAVDEASKFEEFSFNLKPWRQAEQMSAHTLEEAMQDGLLVPRVLTLLPELVRSTGHGLRTDGIFRLSARPSELQSLRTALARGDLEAAESLVRAANDPITPAAMLKEWLRSLKEPLIPQEFYDECIGAFDAWRVAQRGKDEAPRDAARQRVLTVLNKVPALNQRALRVVASLMLESAAEEEHSRMSLDNLAIVFAPSILRNPSLDAHTLLLRANTERGFAVLLAQTVGADEETQRLLQRLQQQPQQLAEQAEAETETDTSSESEMPLREALRLQSRTPQPKRTASRTARRHSLHREASNKPRVRVSDFLFANTSPSSVKADTDSRTKGADAVPRVAAMHEHEMELPVRRRAATVDVTAVGPLKTAQMSPTALAPASPRSDVGSALAGEVFDALPVAPGTQVLRMQSLEELSEDEDLGVPEPELQALPKPSAQHKRPASAGDTDVPVLCEDLDSDKLLDLLDEV